MIQARWPSSACSRVAVLLPGMTILIVALAAVPGQAGEPGQPPPLTAAQKERLKRARPPGPGGP